MSFPKCTGLPGLEATQGPNAPKVWFHAVHFGGTREYVDDEDGFQVYYAKQRGRKGKWQGNKKRQDVVVKAAQPFLSLDE